MIWIGGRLRRLRPGWLFALSNANEPISEVVINLQQWAKYNYRVRAIARVTALILLVGKRLT